MTSNPNSQAGTYKPVILLALPALFLLAPQPAFPQASFEVKDTVCIDEMIHITNNSRDAATYYWNFCSGNLFYSPEGENLPNPGTLDGPAFIDFAVDNGNYYAFITNHTDGTITRNFYGSDFLGTPVSENLGNSGGIIPLHVQGVQVVSENGDWYVFLVGGQRTDSRLVRLDFGNSLSNAPAAVNLGNFGGSLDYPEDLYLLNEDGTWYGFTVNYNTNSVTRFDFAGTLADPAPGVVSFSGLGLDGPTGLFPIKENGTWYLFVSSMQSNEIIRLELGASLTGDPVPASIGNSSYLYRPFDLTILRDCEGLFGFVLNRFNDIVRMDFNRGIDQSPDFLSLGDPGSLFNPHGISDVFRVGDTLYAFVANIDNNSITRLYFPGCDNASISSSTDRDPPDISYNAPGNYNIQLVLDEGTPQQENFCRNVVVLESPQVDLGNDTLLPPGGTLILDAGDHTAWQWSTGEASRTIEVGGPGTYTVVVTNEYGCTATDEITVTMEIGIPNFFTPNGDGINDTWEIPYLESVPQARVFIYDRFGRLVASYLYGNGGWDGTCNGQAVRGDTYWYVIEMGSGSKPLKGSVTVRR
jgi:gliding motility-associated-like protein